MQIIDETLAAWPREPDKAGSTLMVTPGAAPGRSPSRQFRARRRRGHHRPWKENETRRLSTNALIAALFLLVPAGPAAADPPTEVTFAFAFDDVDPCTGEIHNVSFELTTYQHEHDGRFVEQGKTTITTSPTGYVGRGTHTLQINEQNLVFRSNDMLTNDAHDRIRVRIVLVLDLSTGTVRVDKSEFTCVGA